ncbi:MAG: isochorismatase [Gemmatimonadaceae bacterium]
MRPYEPRPIRVHGIRDVDGWRLKRYSIMCGSDSIDWRAFEPAITLTEAALPQPAVTPARPGVGFLILHQGRTALYCVLGWWDNENELPVRVFVRGLENDAEWRAARGSESFCVWDLQVIAFEREAYVATVLASGADIVAATRAYLGASLTREPAEPQPAGAAARSGAS